MNVSYPELPESTLDGYDLLRGDCGRYELKLSGLLELKGEDRKGWLQGQVTNDVKSLTPGTSLAFCVCSPTGQLIAACEIWAVGESFLVRVPKARMEELLKIWDRAILLADVQITDRTGDFRLVSIQGPAATGRLRQFFELPTLDAGTVEFEGVQIIVLRSNRTGLGGWDLLLPLEHESLAQKIEAAFEAIDERAFDIARLEAGYPRFGMDMDERTLPPEMGAQFEARTISYNKGCYTGQEVLMRLHSRGHTNKTWMGLIANQPIPVGATVSHRSRPDAGIVTSADESPQYGFIAGVMLRREAAFHGETVTVQTPEGPVEAEVRNLPFLRLD